MKGESIVVPENVLLASSSTTSKAGFPLPDDDDERVDFSPFETLDALKGNPPAAASPSFTCCCCLFNNPPTKSSELKLMCKILEEEKGDKFKRELQKQQGQ